MNLSLLQPAPISTLAWHIFLETLAQGQVSAWISEFPECKVVAESQEAAIEALKTLLNQRMETVKVMPLQLLTENLEDPWLGLCGSLKDDASFTKWSDRFWAEKQQNIEDDEILSVEENLSVM